MEKTSTTRARDRANWPIKVYKLGEEPSDDLSESTTPEERLVMMWELAERGWLLTGREIPDYHRENMPGRVIRNGR